MHQSIEYSEGAIFSIKWEICKPPNFNTDTQLRVLNTRNNTTFHTHKLEKKTQHFLTCLRISDISSNENQSSSSLATDFFQIAWTFHASKRLIIYLKRGADRLLVFSRLQIENIRKRLSLLTMKKWFITWSLHQPKTGI